ncbi:aldose 1-epimerase family protein [Algoriphagus namhaensis]|uniref:Aldose 1-epimerase family protein n=1 Tax=Algoriphagus namhaensis TaxID=915353 RepID=A0ABV8AU04_9BACT
MNPKDLSSWKSKISNSHQLGGIETSIVDNGGGKGTRIAWINTGSGLRFKVVLDRGMDIVDAFFNENSLAWISHAGITSHQPFSDQGINWLKTFAGGLLTTCGLSSMGPPNGDHGLHGRYANLPAELISVKQPDIFSGDLTFELVGKIMETSTFGPSLELIRKISGRLGSPEIHVSDSVRNLGNTAAPLMLLYHINCGWPLIDEGTRIVWKGELRPTGHEAKTSDFNRKHQFKVCPPPLDEHAGFGEDVAFIDPQTDLDELLTCGYANDEAKIALKIQFSKKQLPWLIHWQHMAKGEYVTALEPATHPPIGQANAQEDGSLILLQPGEKREFELKMEVLTGEKVKEFNM